MGYHLYCVVPAGHAPSGDLRGLSGAEVTDIRVGDLAVWCSASEARIVPDLRRIRVHDGVIRKATTATVTPLPFRFGQWFPDREALGRELQARLDGYRQALDRVAGAVEFGVRLEALRERSAEGASRGSSEAPHGTGAGAAYLRALADRGAERDARLQHGGAVLAELNLRLEGRVVQVRVDRTPGRGSVASAAYLVRCVETGRFREAVEGFADGHVAFEFHLTGPWPPYSFT